MGNVGMNISTTINWWMIKRTLKVGAYKLDASLYKKVIKAYKTMIIHTLVWIGIATVVGVLLAVSCFLISTKKLEGLLQEHNAVEWTQGVRVNATTVQHTRGESYKYDLESIKINLDKDFPGQRSLILLLNENNELMSVVGSDEFDNIIDYKGYGILSGLIVACIIMILYAVFVRRTSYGKIWYAFMRWANNPGEDTLNSLEKIV